LIFFALYFWLHGLKNYQNKAVQLLHVFAPMLCKRPTRKLEDTVREMGGSGFYIEEKLDGERMQLHKRGNEYFYGSRPVQRYFDLAISHMKQEGQGLHISLWKTRWNRQSDSTH